MCAGRRDVVIAADGRPAVVRLTLALTFATGVVDAVGFLGLDRVFTGNMTGNVVILAMALAGAEQLPVLGPLLALVAFMMGAALGGRVLRGRAPGWGASTTIALGMVALLLGLAAVALAVTDDRNWGVTVASSTTLALAMGLQAAAARGVGVKDVTTVVVTSTITGLAADSRLGAGAPALQLRRAFAIVVLLAGAVLGAIVVKHDLSAGIACAALMATCVTVAGECLRQAAKRHERNGGI